jgi:hypothetical protein
MKTIKAALGFAAVLSLITAGMAVADCGRAHAGKGHGACAAKGDCTGFDKAATTTLQGTVVSIDKEKCEGCGMMHVDVVLKTKDDEVTVRLGPSWYLDNQDETLKKDDQVEIFASKVKFAGEDMFVAGKITKGDDVLLLRDKDGFPMWQGWRRGRV